MSTVDRARLQLEARRAQWALLESMCPRSEAEWARLRREVAVEFDLDGYRRARALRSDPGEPVAARAQAWQLVKALQLQLRTFTGFLLVCDQIAAMGRSRLLAVLDQAFDAVYGANLAGYDAQARRLDLLCDLLELAAELVDQADPDPRRELRRRSRRGPVATVPFMSLPSAFGGAVDMADPPEPGELPRPAVDLPVAARSPHRARPALPWLGDLDALLARVVERPLDPRVWSALKDTALSDLQVLEDEVSGARDHYGLCHYSQAYADDPLKRSAFVGSEPELASADLDDDDWALLGAAEDAGAVVPWYFRRGVAVEPETARGFTLAVEFDPNDVLALVRLDELATQFVSAEDRFDVDPRDWLISDPPVPVAAPGFVAASPAPAWEDGVEPGTGLVPDLDGGALTVASAADELRAYHALAATRLSQLEAFQARVGRLPLSLDELESWLDEWDVRRVNGRDDRARRRRERQAWYRSLPAAERARLRAEWFGPREPAPDLDPAPADDADYAASWQ